MGRVRRTSAKRRTDAGNLPDGLVLLDGSGAERLELDPDALDQGQAEVLVGGRIHARLRHATAMVLWPEFASPYDSLAVGVWVQGHRIGWLGHADSARWHATLRQLAEVGQAIELGAVLETDDVDGSGAPRLGGWLAFDPIVTEEHARAAVSSFALIGRR